MKLRLLSIIRNSGRNLRQPAPSIESSPLDEKPQGFLSTRKCNSVTPLFMRFFGVKFKFSRVSNLHLK
jgi:hypothetical protein